jgi:hypothetical protein
MDPEKTSRTVTAGLQIMPMGPSAVFEEAALITGIFNHNRVVSQLTRVAIHQIYNIDTPFELSKELQIKFRLGTTNNEIAIYTGFNLVVGAPRSTRQCVVLAVQEAPSHNKLEDRENAFSLTLSNGEILINSHVIRRIKITKWRDEHVWDVVILNIIKVMRICRPEIGGVFVIVD